MIFGHIKPQWDLDYIKNMEFVDYNYNSGQYKTPLEYIDKQDLNRYNIHLQQIRNQEDNQQFSSILKEFSWLTDIKLQVNCQEPGAVIPRHTDVYRYYRETFNLAPTDPAIRILVMLEDWQSGQYLEISERGFTNWRAGDWFGFDLLEMHMSANLGSVLRYLVQLNGRVKK